MNRHPLHSPIETFYPLNCIIRQMKNPAPADRPILDPLCGPVEPRHLLQPSCRTRQVGTAVFEAARWAASSSNEQPWSFVMATQQQPELFEKLRGLPVSGKRVGEASTGAGTLGGANGCFQDSDNPNRYAFHDTGLAVGNLLAQATADGIVRAPDGRLQCGKGADRILGVTREA